MASLILSSSRSFAKGQASGRVSSRQHRWNSTAHKGTHDCDMDNEYKKKLILSAFGRKGCQPRESKKHSRRKLSRRHKQAPRPTELHFWISAVTQNTKDRESPLDEGTANEMTISAAQRLTASDLHEVVEEQPGMVRKKNRMGMTPVHYALMRNAEESVLKRLLSVCTGMALLEECDGLSPLHVAATKGLSSETFKLILDAAGNFAPKLARKHVDSNLTKGLPFHFLCETFKRKDHVNDELLHLLIDTMMIDCESEVEHPLGRTDIRGRTPLHWAAWLGTDISVLHKLVKHHPEALAVVAFPVHAFSFRIPLCEAKASLPTTGKLENIRFLMKAWLSGVEWKDLDGLTLLHQQLTGGIFESALEIWRSGVDCRALLSPNGVPRLCPRRVTLFLSKSPDAALEAEPEEFLTSYFRDVTASLLRRTIGHARQRGDPRHFYQTVVALVEGCPAVLGQRNEDNGWTPLHFRLLASDRSRPEQWPNMWPSWPWSPVYTRWLSPARMWSVVSRSDPTTLFMIQQYPAALYLPVETQEWTNVRGSSSIVESFLPGTENEEGIGTERLVRFLQSTLAKGDQVLTPLHIVSSHSAAHSTVFFKTVSLLYKLDPGAIRQEVSDIVPHGGKGRLPLHVASAQPGCRANSVKMLYNMYKPAIREEDAGGCVPFEIAVRNEEVTVECLYFLLCEWPDVLQRESCRVS